MATCLAVSGTNLYAGVWSHGMYLSTDYGSSWISDNSYLYINSLAVSGPNLIAATLGNGVFISSNNGATWDGSERRFNEP